MGFTLNIFVVLTLLGGIFVTAGAGHETNSSLGAAAGGLFVCLGLCLLSLTMLEIAERKAARESEKGKK